MALFHCPECKREVSTDAKACPHCGKDVRFAGAGARWENLPKAMKIFLAVGAAMFLLVMCVGRAQDKPNLHTAASAAAGDKASTPLPATGGSMTVPPGTWFGFRSREDMSRATNLAVQGDKDAWSTFMAKAMVNGQCVKLKEGEKMFLEDTAVMSGAIKVRRKGEVDGWWTNIEAVK